MIPSRTRPPALALMLLAAGCQTTMPDTPRSVTASPAAPPALAGAAPAVAPPPPAEPSVRATIVPGSPVAPPPPAAQSTQARPGDVTLNFPGVPAPDVARAVLGDILGLQYSVAPNVGQPVTLVTQRPVARADVLRLFEEALRAAGLALVPQGGVFQVMPAEQAKSAAASVAAGAGTPGYARETARLEFVSAAELRKIIDPVLPGVIQSVDEASNSIVYAGTSGQRRSVQDLVRQFDVNWLRGVSFGLFVPQRTDARLIVPELDKVLNAEGAPTRGLVRLIAMERLNGVLAVSGQRQYLEDVRRWVEILDREGEAAEPKFFVYRVQNGRAGDLAEVLTTAFSGGGTVQAGQPNAVGAIGTGRQIGGTVRDRDTTGRTGATGRSGEGAAPFTTLSPSGVTTTTTDAAGTAGGAAGAVRTGRLSAPARGLAGTVTQPGGSGGQAASITADEGNNAIVVYGTPQEYAVIEGALRQLDVPPLQVLIEASIAEVTLTDDLRFGVQSIFDVRNGQIQISDPGAIGQPITRTSPTSTGNVVGQIIRQVGFSFLVANGDFTAVLNALEQLTDVKVVSSPKLMVLNNQTASLQVGEQVPVPTRSAQSVIDPDAPTVSEIEYRDTGVILQITPRVNAGGLVLLDVAQEVSDIGPLVEAGGSTALSFTTRRVATSIAVSDGETIGLGGLISDSRTKGRRGLPFLSQIPIIGALFGTQTRDDERTELLILLRPRVVRTPDDARAVTEELRRKLKTIAPLERRVGSIP